MGVNPVSIASYGRLLKNNRNFRLLWLAQIVSELGDWLYTVAIYSLLLELTGSARAISAAVVLQLLPQFFLGPTAGIINDKISRKRVMIFADLVRAGIVAAMVLVRSADWVWAIYVLLFLETVMWAFFEPGRNAAIPNIVAEGDDLVAANALGSMTWSANLALGSGLGGAVAVIFGRDAVFVINAVSFLASAALIRAMRFEEPHVGSGRKLAAGDLADTAAFTEGLRYIFGKRRLLATMLLKAGLGLTATHWVILPVFGEKIFPLRIGGLDAQRAGMLGMSVLLSARGVGAIIGPLFGGYWTGDSHLRMRRGALYGFLLVAAGYVLLSIAPNASLAVLSVLVTHAGGSIIWVFSSTLLQMESDDRFRGRVFSADFGGMALAMSVTTWAAGMAYDGGAGVRTIAAATAAIALVPAAVWALAQRFWREPRSGI
jgi:MFS family permease